MLVDQLNIQRFRGISSILELDLSAPLTVLYAPNGTGKTSVCDAMEWLLCGGIGRLSFLDKNDVRCRFGESSLETFVEATIPYNNKPFSIKRILSDSGTQLFWKDENCDYKLVNDHELLRRFIPALPPSGNSSRAKIDWVRSTRFLDSASLSLLIDSDKESNDTRKLIFSSLFGVSEYQKAENDLSRILKKLPAESTIKKEKSKLQTKIEEYEASIKRLVAEEGEPYRDHATNLLNVIAKHLNSKNGMAEESSLQDYHKQLEIQLIQSNESLNDQKSALLFIKEKFNLYTENVSTSEELRKNLKIDNDTLISLNNDYSKKKLEFEKEQATFEQREKLISELSETLNVLRQDKIKYNQLYKLYHAPTLLVANHEARLDEIKAYVASGEQKVLSLQEKLSMVDKCIERLPSWLKKGEELNGINTELEAFISEQSRDSKEKSLIERISEVKAQINLLQSSREKALGELELLLSSGKRYVETHAHDTACPLCEHQYETNLALQEKINARFSKLSEKSKGEAMLASQLEELTKQLQQENKRQKQYQELINQKNLLLHGIHEIENEFAILGLTKEELSKAEVIAQKFDDTRDQYQVEVSNTFEDMAPYKSASDAAKQLEEMLIRIEFLSSSWIQKFEQNASKLLTIDNLGEVITALESLLEYQVKSTKQIQEETKPVVISRSNDLKMLQEAMNKKSAILSSTKEKLNFIATFIKEFERKWTVISNTQDINDLDLEKAANALDEKSRILNEVKSLFEKVDEYFTKIRESEKSEAECKLYQKEVQAAKEQLQEWCYQEDARRVAEKEINSIQEEIRRFVSHEIAPLSNIISTLYLRAQGNRFINSIAAEPTKDGLLNWIARLDESGESFDKMQTLSQGQRQDLALSIFLARARSIGGTFFMDEPLAHLDDLNRVALLDTLRVIVSEKFSTSPLRLILTTASNNLLRHLREKFSLVEGRDGNPALRIYKMTGNPKIGIEMESPELVHSPIKLM